MAEPTPSADQTASGDARVAEQETNLVTNPKGDESSEAPKAQSALDSAKEAAASAATTATTTAANMKDNVFSMFGGGQNKERK